MSLPRFGVTRPVPVNILMACFLAAGVLSGLTMTREFFPETAPESATITLRYPGATPEEIEESLARKVEDAVADLDEVERLTTMIAEGGGGITVEFRDGVDVMRATDEVERAIDALTDLPDEAERIQVTELEPQLPVIMVTLYGPVEEEALKRAVRRMRDDLQTLPGMGEMVLSGVRDYEIRVDASYESLIAHRLSLPALSDTIRAWMTDLPGGTVRTEVGNINVRTMGVEERAAAIRDIVVKATPDGQVLRVRDVATVSESYVDEEIKTRFRGADAEGPAASLTVYKVGDQDAVTIAKMVRAYVQGRRAAAGFPEAGFEMEWTDRVLGALASASSPGTVPRTRARQAYDLGFSSPAPLPAGCAISTSSDLARFIEGRLDLLLRNAKWGALLVFATLLVFLNWRTAFWVGIGLTTALCGTLLFMKLTGTTLNLLTMFGLIVVLGLLVDDAIVVAENIQARHDRNEPALTAAIHGAEEVFWPVVATILTSIVAFLPLTFIKGQIGDLLGALPWVVACALVMSLVESVLILPSHMGHSLVHRDRLHADHPPGRLGRLEEARDRLIFERLVPAYARLLGWCVRYRYLTIAVAISVLLASLGVVAGGRTQFTFIPASDSETIIVELKMPIGTAVDATEAVVQRMEAAAMMQPETKTINTLIGVQASVDDTTGVTAAGFGSHLGQLFVELLPVEERDRESSTVIAAIRDELGVVEGVDSISYAEIQGGPGGKDITIEVVGEDRPEVEAVVTQVKEQLATLDGVYDIADDNSAGQREVQVTLKPGAATLGFTVADVARQVRGALFGLEAHVYSADREDIDVRVRLDEASRRSLATIEGMWLVGPGGILVPLPEIATIAESRSFKTIRRVDRRRATSVTADTAPGVSPESIVPAIMPALRDLERMHPTVTIETAGRQRQFRKAFESLPVGFGAALALIYVILAWLFGSYVQPIAVMLAIPFGTIGVIWGHVLLGYDLTFFSVIGFVALSGIVVNDSLILVQFFNQRRASGEGLAEALVAAGRQRLRPILLTTVTTVLGLTPLMLEQSFQAKFLIPMAIAIAFGLMSATALILLVLPAIIVIMDDAKAAVHLLWFGERRPPEPGPHGPRLDLEPE
ncbi:MAG: efflux RND transporter permease subunit [Phycisphaerales bacterium]|nr:efflux RND transporter permease subunit [Phycisphaerae bacterium]NNF41578.1 efflux RND transporter permease subunit [Phycisphaerales bacterium]NNM24521.1 efflux RND transporter permease subunit [Phycisphaerales bacterium]